MSFNTIDVAELAVKLAETFVRQKDGEVGYQFIDVREVTELEIVSLSGFVNLPLSEYPTWSETIADQFDPTLETYVLCHHGIRSAQMCAWLVDRGFTLVYNVHGGIDRFARIVDRSLAIY
jgi:rhodanese-related sulfurtransferase